MSGDVESKEKEFSEIRVECDEGATEEDYSDDPPPSYSIFAISNPPPPSPPLPPPPPPSSSQSASADPLERRKSSSDADDSFPSSLGLPSSSPDDDDGEGGGGEGDCKDCKRRSKPESIGRKTWKEFTRDTTLHGIRYVFDENPFPLRRFVWLLCVLTCFVLFGYQAIDRVCTYFRYSSYINVQVVYGDTIEFPSVTICNYNKYRLTAVVDRGLYGFIDDIYRSEYLSGRPIPKQDNDNENSNSSDDLQSQNLTAFLLATAHQRTDFIYSCIWRGEKCNAVFNFTTQFTDFGVCYTFNTDLCNRLEVNKSGAGFALSLTLNIEQYEYMSGPDHEAGVKVLLHDPNEIPQVADLGFAIAPGTHTLVGVRRKVTDSLEAPYGTCVSGARPRSFCLVQCLARQIYRACDCVDVYMDTSENHTNVCDMSTAFTCVNAKLAMATHDMNVDCNCPGPCRKITYEPKLSYAQLSTTNFDRTSLDDSPRVRRIAERFARARDVAQRVNQDLVEKNSRLIASLVDATRRFRSAVLESKMALTNDTYILSRYRADQEMIENVERLSDDISAINSSFTSKAAACLVVQPDLVDYVNMAYGLRTYFLQTETTPLQEMLLRCRQLEENGDAGGGDATTTTTTTTPMIRTANGTVAGGRDGVAPASSPSDDDLGPFYDCDETNRTYYFFAKMSLIGAKKDAELAAKKIANMADTYRTTMDFVFGGTSVDYLRSVEHRNCVDALANASSFWLPMIETFAADTADRYLNASRWGPKIDAADEIDDFADLTTNPAVTLLAAPKLTSSKPGPQFDACRWYLRKDWAEILSDPSYVLFQFYAENALRDAHDFHGQRQSLSVQAASLLEELADTEDYLLGPLLRYLNASGGLTKLELQAFIASSAVNLREEARKLSTQRYVSEWQQFLGKISEVSENAKVAFQCAFNFSVPAMNASLVNSLRVIRYARRLLNVTGELQKAVTFVKADPAVAVPTVVKELYVGFERMMQEVQDDISQKFRSLELSTESLRDDLNLYAKEIEMNEQFLRDNFIKVDIFYKDLSYEKVSLQVSFEMMSLFSEIGGLLGLLLGASILTVLELVDFVFLLAVRNFRNGEAASDST